MRNRRGGDKEERKTDSHREKEKEGRKRGLAEANRFPPAALEQRSSLKPFKTTVQKATAGPRLN